MLRFRLFHCVVLTGLAAGSAAWGQTFKATPVSLKFTYQVGATSLPAAQAVSITGGTSAAPISYTSAVAGGNWLTMTPASGITPVSAKVSVNPTSLAVGTYTGTITLTPTPGAAVSVTVTLVVSAPPPTLTAQPSPLAISYRRGDPPPSATNIALTTTGLVAYTAKASGGSWFSITKNASGMVFPAFPTNLEITVTPANLGPGLYKGTITISAPAAANKSQVVQVNLTVGAGPASLDWVFPAQVTAGAGATTITLRGDNFYTGTTVKADTTTLSATLVGPNVMTAVIPSSMLATGGTTLDIVASNPGADGGNSNAVTFSVVAAGPTISAILNGASFQQGSIAPGQLVAIFGTGMGPDALAVFTDPGTGNPIATTLSGTRVLFDNTPAPVIYTSASQVAVMAPYDIAGKTTVDVSVEYNTVVSPDVTMNVATHSPALFTASGAGSGQAAVLNVDSLGAVTVNSETNAAPKGSVVMLYATGEGVTTPASTDGSIVTTAAATPNPGISVQVGGKDAEILYTGGVPGLVSGILQINARLATDTTAGKAVPIVLTINGVSSPAGVTIGVK